MPLGAPGVPTEQVLKRLAGHRMHRINKGETTLTEANGALCTT